MEKGRLLTATFFLILLTGQTAGITVVNSQDWGDVYSGMQHNYENTDDRPYFVRSPQATGVLRIMPEGESITIIQSEENPMSENLEARFESNGYNVEETVEVNNANTELIPEDTEDFIIVSEDYPSASIAAAPLAETTDAWVLIASNDNLDEIQSTVSEAEGNVWMVGTFNREIEETLTSYATEKIIDSNRFNLSVKLAQEFTERNPENSRAIITGGRFLESDLIRGRHPVLLSGTNLISEPVREFLFEDPKHQIDSTIMIGNQMTSVGEDIRDRNVTRNGEETEEKISVFVKYGQARGDSSSIYALSLFPIPQGDINLSISEVRYSPEEKEMYITYDNTGKSKMYELTSFRVMNQGEEVASGSDNEPVFLGGEDSRTVSYSVDLGAEEYRNAEVEFSTSFGETSDNLDTYLTQSDEFSPPVRKDLTVEEVSDRSNVSLKSASYIKDLERIEVKVENTGNTTAYSSVHLMEVSVKGKEESFETGIKELGPGESESFYVPVKLDRIDVQENSEIDTAVNYGEREDLLVNLERKEIDLQVKQGPLTARVTNSTTGAGVAVTLLVLAVVFIGFFKRERVEETLQSFR